MKALISPSQPASYISGWDTTAIPATPIYTEVGPYVVEVVETPFEVASPLFFVECDSDVVAYSYYYNETQSKVMAIPPNEPQPE